MKLTTPSPQLLKLIELYFRFYRGSAAALVVFDITNQKTFESLDTWLGEIDKYADKDIVLMLVGNKSDLVRTRAVDYATANKYASKDIS